MVLSKEGTWSFSKEENPDSLQLELAEHITLHSNGEPLLGRAPIFFILITAFPFWSGDTCI